MAFQLKSSAFVAQGAIPSRHTCDGADLSPSLSWEDPPKGTQSYALIVDDPDAPAGTWVHWVIYDIPGEFRQLSEGLPTTEHLANGARQGRNDFQKIGYGGPCPPRGPAHRYFFKLYALNAKLGLPPRATKPDLENAMRGKVVGEAVLIGTYKR